MGRFLFLFVCCLFLGKITIAQGTKYLYTVAGGGATYCDNCPATSTQMSMTDGIWGDAAGNIYVAVNHAYVRKINTTTGLINTYMGNDSGTYSGDGGPATAAAAKPNSGVFVDGENNIYFSQDVDDVVRKVNAATGIISSFAGICYMYGSTEDGGPATAAHLSWPSGLIADPAGNVYIVGYASIREVNGLTGIIRTIAGNDTAGYSGDGGPATAAMISDIVYGGMAFDAYGNLYFADEANNVIREIQQATGNIYTVAGGGTTLGDGGPAIAANLSSPGSIAFDTHGDLIIGDNGNSRIRMVDPTGIITTVAGTGNSMSPSSDGTPALSAYIQTTMFYLDNVGNLYFSDNNDVVRMITNFYPNLGISTGIVADSFTVFQNALCNGPQIYISTPHYAPGYNMVTLFGDGSTDTTLINPYLGGGNATINHSYPASGVYTITHTLYNGTTFVGTISYPYNYTFCRTLQVDVYHDANNNCIKEPGESFTLLPALAVVDSNGIAVDTMSLTSGLVYNAYGNPGDIYSFGLVPDPGGIVVTCPTSGTVSDTISSSVSSYPAKYLAVNCFATAGFDLAINASNTECGPERQRGNINVSNLLCTDEPATVTLQFSPRYIYRTATPLSTSSTATSVTWTFPYLWSLGAPENLFYYLENSGSVLTSGDTVHTYLTVTPITGDTDFSNNTEMLIDTVEASFDPNNITSQPPGCLPVTTTQLQYTINFENTGTDTAFNIYVMDTLPGYLNMNSLRLVAASATMDIDLFKANNFNIAKFNFPNINLLDSSNPGLCSGFVTFTINFAGNLTFGTTIDNNAGIYFDQNPVVLTNTIENTIGCADLSVTNITKETPEIELYPNPTSGEITIKTVPGRFNSFIITNPLGQHMMEQSINSSQTIVNIHALPAGVYYVTFNGDNGTVVRKVVKM